MKRILAIHDLSGFGRCSLTVALPIISAMGIECVCLPTAVLSAHTAIDGYFCRDLSEDMPAFFAHYDKLGLEFDTIYSGYLASTQQIALVKKYVETHKNARYICDPAMADDGEFYPPFDGNFAARMGELCAIADVIVPNQTEAAMLLGQEINSPIDMLKLQKISGGSAVLTGFEREGKLGAACIDRAGSASEFLARKYPRQYCGGGDVFACVLAGALTLGYTLADATKKAVSFTSQAAGVSFESNSNPLFGFEFEGLIQGGALNQNP
ncbi:MAG: PfkB family carbohydrate kinase [Oscillospiraceae bacterium]|nr:PfkB family carbohydrate kinase [Oscillospiraceae bacterium]